MSNTSHLPVAVRVGATHVSVAQMFSGKWAAVVWSLDEGSSTIGGVSDYGTAVKRAREYAATFPGSVLELDDRHGLIHVWRLSDRGFEVHQESRSGESFACLQRFGPQQREEAVQFALEQLGMYSPCRLGRVDL